MTDVSDSPLVYVGSYTANMNNARGTGITVCRQDPATGMLEKLSEVEADSPSYLALHPSGHVLYSVNERDPAGSVSAYKVDGDQLKPLGEQSSGGDAPCHLTVDPSGQYVIAANYMDGSISASPLGLDGGVRAYTDRITLDGITGPNKDRQEGPHAHHVSFTPDGLWLVVMNLGGDLVHHFRFDPRSGLFGEADRLLLAPGTGPRHLAYGPERAAWVVGELVPSLVPLLRNEDTGELEAAGDPVPVATSGDKTNTTSAIVFSPDHRFVYVGNRGPDSITVHDGATGEQLAEVPAGGGGPRDVSIIGDFLYSANKVTDTVTVFRRDAATGGLEPLGVALETGSPSCVLAAQ